MRNLTNHDIARLLDDEQGTTHRNRPEWARKSDSKRAKGAKRETLARRQARNLKRETVAA